MLIISQYFCLDIQMTEHVTVCTHQLTFKTLFFSCIFQDPEKLQPLFQVAMQLSRSSKPYDCVTASYLLNFLIHQKGLLSICSESYQLLGMFQPNEDLPADSLEKNTLSGHYFTFCSLKFPFCIEK